MRSLAFFSFVLLVEARWKLSSVLDSGEELHHRKHHHHKRHENEEEHGCYWTCPPGHGFEGCDTPFNGVGHQVTCPNTEYCAKFISYGGEDETGVILPLVIRHCGFREAPNFGLDHHLVCVEVGVTNVTMKGRNFEHFCCRGHLCNSANAVTTWASALLLLAAIVEHF